MGIAPVVPGRLPLLGHTMSLLGRRFQFLSSLRSHGEVVRIYLGRLPVYVVTSPEPGCVRGSLPGINND